MKTAVCTIFEGHYHYGVAALANSLYSSGFRGTFYVGIKGPYPSWAAEGVTRGEALDFSPTEGLTLRFLPAKTDRHLANHKADFMLELLEQHAQDIDALHYFDPDIIVTANWAFFDSWVEDCVALCQNTGAWCPRNHPFRREWRKFLKLEGLPELNLGLDEYFNSGYVGVARSAIGFLKSWSGIQTALARRGLIDLQKISASCANSAYNANDQDALNVAAMVHGGPISSVGEEGMGFASGGGGPVMLHALGSPKPWKKIFWKRGLRGNKPSQAEAAYWNHCQAPIQTYSPLQLKLHKIDLFLGRALGRYL